jgi:hypothetical protein
LAPKGDALIFKRSPLKKSCRETGSSFSGALPGEMHGQASR